MNCYNKSFIDQACPIKVALIGLVLFCVFIDLSSSKKYKKELGQHPVILASRLVNNAYSPISIKVALGILLWSLKAIVWRSLKQSIALYCILCFNDQIPKQLLLKQVHTEAIFVFLQDIVKIVLHYYLKYDSLPSV